MKHIKQDMEKLRRGASEGEDAYLSLDKKEFRMTEFGAMMVNIIMEWDQVMHDYYGGLAARETNPEVEKKFIQCLAQWEVCQIVMRQFYGIEYHFTRTDEYFGICTEDESDWLVKVYRPDESRVVVPQKVTRKGIKVDGQEYWNSELELRFLGREVNVEFTPCEILVKDIAGEIITTFDRTITN